MKIASAAHVRYLAVLAATSLILVILAVAACFRALYLVPSNQSAELVQYQKRKIASASRDTCTIFVGDSSLGNSVDATLYTQLTGEKSLNLALSGVFGYEGTYNMIKAAAARLPLKKVIIVQTADLLTREPWPEGYVYTAQSPADFRELDWAQLSAELQAVGNLLLSWRTLLDTSARAVGLGPSHLVFQNDYPRQGEPLSAERLARSRITQQVHSERELWLRKIADFCAARGIELIYLHGPLSRPVYDNSVDYLSRANGVLAKSGLKFDPMPFLVPPEETGDAFDHVRPAYKQDYTRRYVDKLKAIEARSLNAP